MFLPCAEAWRIQADEAVCGVANPASEGPLRPSGQEVGDVDVGAQIRLGWLRDARRSLERGAQGFARKSGLAPAETGALGAALHRAAAAQLGNAFHHDRL